MRLIGGGGQLPQNTPTVQTKPPSIGKKWIGFLKNGITHHWFMLMRMQ
jgi:hypothetical protein